MSRASLWLLPPRADHPFAKSLNKLITDTVPSNFPDVNAPQFSGHVTLTPSFDAASTYKSSEQAQAWLDGLNLPASVSAEKDEAVIEFMELDAGDPFFRKLILTARKDANFLKLAANVYSQVHSSSDEAAQEWTEDDYAPHLSLLYADASKHDIEQKMHKVELQLGFEFGDLFACCGGMLAQGARLAVVDISSGEDVKGWKVLAERDLNWVVWKAARALI